MATQPNPLANLGTVSKYPRLIDMTLDAGLVPLLLGKPGVGKSSYLQQAAGTNNLKYVDVRLTGKEAADIGGLPDFIDITDSNGVVTGRKTTFTPTDLFPLKGVTSQDELIKRDEHGNVLYEKNSKEPQRYDGWLVNLEEFTSADDAVQAACYQLILDRMVGTYELHDNVWLTACGNGANDGAIASKVGTAIKSRVVTIMVDIDLKGWKTWAYKNKVSQFILDYIEWRPDMIHKFDPRSDDVNFACPRTWKMLSDLMVANGNNYDADLHELASGTIGKLASEFKQFISYYAKLPSIANILKSPKTADVPTDAGELYAMCGVMAQALADNYNDVAKLGDFMEYIERMPKEHQTVTIVNASRKKRLVSSKAPITKWTIANAALVSAAL